VVYNLCTVQVVSDYVNTEALFHSNLHLSYSVQSNSLRYIETDFRYDKATQTYSAVTTDGMDTIELLVGLLYAHLILQ
jgi:hypothetical protein